VTIYENNEEQGPTGGEGGELLDVPVNRRKRGAEAADDEPTAADDRAEADQPGLDTTNLPGDNRAPASAHPWRGAPAGESSTGGES
jgi:hypothetical protein